MDKKVHVHTTAVIDDGAEIGEGTRIWHFVHVSGGAQIGANVTLGQGVFVGNEVVIGNNCKIQNNVSLYDRVTLEEGVFCGPSMVFTNVINPRSHINRREEYKDTRVCRGASLGANSTLVCGVEIGEFALVGAGTVVTKNVKAFALVVGVPARQIGWISAYGERIPLPLVGSGNYVCPKSDDFYELREDELSRSPS